MSSCCPLCFGPLGSSARSLVPQGGTVTTSGGHSVVCSVKEQEGESSRNSATAAGANCQHLVCQSCLGTHLGRTIKLFGTSSAAVEEQAVEDRYSSSTSGASGTKKKNGKKKAAATAEDQEDAEATEEEDDAVPNALNETAELDTGSQVSVSQQRHSTVKKDLIGIDAPLNCPGCRRVPHVLTLSCRVSAFDLHKSSPAQWFADLLGGQDTSVIATLFPSPSATAPTAEPEAPAASAPKKNAKGKKAVVGKGGKSPSPPPSQRAVDPAVPLVPSTCGICEEEEGAVECKECQFALCDGCQRAVHSKGRFKQHNVVPLGTLQATMPTKCPEHAGYNQELFCEDCRVPMCLLCGYQGLHKGHAAKPLQEVVGEVKAHLAAQVGRLQLGGKMAGSLRQQLTDAVPALESQYTGLSTGVQDAFSRLRNALNARERFLLERLGNLHQQRKDSLTRNTLAVDALCSEVESLQAHCLKVTGGDQHKGPMGGNLLSIAPVIEGRLHTLTQHRILAEALSLEGEGEGGGDDTKKGDSEDKIKLWASRYTPTLADVTFHLRPDSVEFTGHSEEGRDSMISNVSAAMMEAGATGDDAFAALIKGAGELSYLGTERQQQQGHGGDMSDAGMVDLSTRPFATPPLRSRQEVQQQPQQMAPPSNNKAEYQQQRVNPQPQQHQQQRGAPSTAQQQQHAKSAPLPKASLFIDHHVDFNTLQTLRIGTQQPMQEQQLLPAQQQQQQQTPQQKPYQPSGAQQTPRTAGSGLAMPAWSGGADQQTGGGGNSNGKQQDAENAPQAKGRLSGGKRARGGAEGNNTTGKLAAGQYKVRI